jgi:hypothetical protein
MPRRRVNDLEISEPEDLIGSAKVVLSIKPHPVLPHLSKEFYRLKLASKENLECAVCMEPINCIHCISLWTCGHAFHARCTEHCITNRCPLCNV